MQTSFSRSQAPQERDDFGAGTQDNALIPMPRTIEPPAGVRTEFDIYCDLEERLDINQRFSLGLNERQWRERFWVEMRETASKPRHSTARPERVYVWRCR